jgi:hypothetical protein
MNASSFEEATDIDYFITNINRAKVTAEWISNSKFGSLRGIGWTDGVKFI